MSEAPEGVRRMLSNANDSFTRLLADLLFLENIVDPVDSTMRQLEQAVRAAQIWRANPPHNQDGAQVAPAPELDLILAVARDLRKSIKCLDDILWPLKDLRASALGTQSSLDEVISWLETFVSRGDSSDCDKAT